MGGNAEKLKSDVRGQRPEIRGQTWAKEKAEA
jgi:hypothetical protein